MPGITPASVTTHHPTHPRRSLPQCTFESGLESGATQLVLPPSLNDTHLLPFLDKYQERYPLWRLDLSDIGSHWHAFAGWDCAGGDPRAGLDPAFARKRQKKHEAGRARRALLKTDACDACALPLKPRGQPRASGW